MTKDINDNLLVNGDLYLKADNYVSLHYGNRGRLGATPFFNPDQNNNGLWLEASLDGSESGGLFCNGETLVLWSPGDNDILRVYDEDDFDRPKFVIDGGGRVGIGTNNPQSMLHIDGDVQLGTKSDEYQLTINSPNISQGGGLILKKHDDTLQISERAIETDKSWLYLNYYSENTVQIGSNSLTPGGMELYGDLNVYGKITASSKSGFVVDRFINQSGGVLEQGDVVVLGESSGEVFYGVEDNIPVPTVDLSTTAYDRRVCGIVSEILIEQEPQLPQTEEMLMNETQKESPEKVREVYEDDGVKRLQVFSAEEIKQLDRKKVEPGQFGCMVTMGCFAHCKVDADITPIAVGDLLATSSTKGYAQKVLEPEKAIGAIVGKALKSLEKGKGKIPVLVMLQ